MSLQSISTSPASILVSFLIMDTSRQLLRCSRTKPIDYHSLHYEDHHQSLFFPATGSGFQNDIHDSHTKHMGMAKQHRGGERALVSLLSHAQSFSSINKICLNQSNTPFRVLTNAMNTWTFISTHIWCMYFWTPPRWFKAFINGLLLLRQ